VISGGEEHLVKLKVVPFAGEDHLGAVGIVVAFAILLRSCGVVHSGMPSAASLHSALERPSLCLEGGNGRVLSELHVVTCFGTSLDGGDGSGSENCEDC